MDVEGEIEDETLFETPLTAAVHGPKDVQAYLAEVTGLLAQIRADFMHEMADSAARCRKQRCPGSSHDFAMQMCGITHGNVVYNQTDLPQFSAFLQAESILLACLAQIEALRKMLVSNKQQKRNAIRRLRELRNSLHYARTEECRECQERAKFMELGTGLEMMDDLLPNPITKNVQRMIESTKQTHRSVSKGLIDQVTRLMSAIRARYILDLAKAAHDTVGAVLEHEKKCQAFMTQCLRLSAIEYCAKLWWFETQNPDSGSGSGSGSDFDFDSTPNYYIHAEVVHDYGDAVEGKTPNCLDHHFKASRAAAYFEFCAENRPAPRICITVHGDPDPLDDENNNSIICKYELDQEFAETILTDEAIDQFEEARNA